MNTKSSPSPESKPLVDYDSSSGRIILTNGCLELVIDAKKTIDPFSLRDKASGFAYADGSYIWPGGRAPEIDDAPVIENTAGGGCSVSLKGRIGPVFIELTYAAPASEPDVLLETIAISNPTGDVVDMSHFKCGFAKTVKKGAEYADGISGIRFCPIPYRRETSGQIHEYPLTETLEHGMQFREWIDTPVDTPVWGSEGWAWSCGPDSFMLAKYNADAMEWSLMEPEKAGGNTVLRFGGAGRWKYGNPESLDRLKPGSTFTFGETCLQVVRGDWKQAYYAYRRYMEGKGCLTREGYNPPVQWNQLYDNQYFWKACGISGNTEEINRINHEYLWKYFTYDMLKVDAQKAKEMGCELLYIDPGWDTGPGHQIWDEERLGPMKDFIDMIKREYGLKVGLWLSLGGVLPTYSDPYTNPVEDWVEGVEFPRNDSFPDYHVHCVASDIFRETKMKRLEELCKNGAGFFLFDSTTFSGNCISTKHGHGVPAGREEHAASLLKLVQHVKKNYPHVFVEMHDPISGPTGYHYTPYYYQYTKPYSYDCIWGHELMVGCMDLIIKRNATSLYYYNLASGIPIYLHIDMRDDNANCLVFWWFASTIRHLGFGGTHKDLAVWEAQKAAMKVYMANKRFFTQGGFFGIDETTHAHTLPDIRESVINCFNLEDAPERRHIRLGCGDIGLPAGRLEALNMPFAKDGDELSLDVDIPARGHVMIKVRSMV